MSANDLYPFRKRRTITEEIMYRIKTAEYNIRLHFKHPSILVQLFNKFVEKIFVALPQHNTFG